MSSSDRAPNADGASGSGSASDSCSDLAGDAITYTRCPSTDSSTSRESSDAPDLVSLAIDGCIWLFVAVAVIGFGIGLIATAVRWWLSVLA